MDHSPGVEFAKRLWAGGEVVFHPGSKDEIVLDGRPWACKEEIGDVRVKHGAAEGSEKVFVDVWRRYGAGHEGADSERKWAIEERRTLVFMRNDASTSQLSPDQSSASPGIKCTNKILRGINSSHSYIHTLTKNLNPQILTNLHTA
jgi:hydroxyacyl-ACP dehydratase HTD2-like protein with hotdog domain